MRSLEDLRFIRDRVLAEIAATPPAGPLLVEPTRRARSSVCQRGHEAMREIGGKWKCAECQRIGKNRRRAAAGRP